MSTADYFGALERDHFLEAMDIRKDDAHPSVVLERDHPIQEEVFPLLVNLSHKVAPNEWPLEYLQRDLQTVGLVQQVKLNHREVHCHSFEPTLFRR